MLLEFHGLRAPRLNDDQRRRLAVKAKAVGRKGLFGIPTLFRPDTILGWHRKLIAIKHDYSDRRRRPGRPPIMKQIREFILRFANDISDRDVTRLQVRKRAESPGHTVTIYIAIVGVPRCPRRFRSVRRECSLSWSPTRYRVYLPVGKLDLTRIPEPHRLQ